ncbi:MULTISPECIES: hypothetical protein [Moorena]|uniref:hypothetical protein n=1 Tax=Moorena TaxID=1155738 RepID=UPI0012B5BE65|nr:MULTISPECIES: hypothetical protein [Moorena]NEP31238.1 hypothetical protein [Moorena sp. SIO3B2]
MKPCNSPSPHLPISPSPHTSHPSHTPDSRFPTPDSLLPTPYSLLPTPYSQLRSPYYFWQGNRYRYSSLGLMEANQLG